MMVVKLQVRESVRDGNGSSAPIAALLLACLIAVFPFAARAEAPTLPRVSPSERMINDLNSGLARENRLRQDQQQNQFELNQIRQRQQMQPFIAPPSALTRPCPPVGSCG